MAKPSFHFWSVAAPMPKPEDLAPSLRGLAYRNGMTIRAGLDFRHDMNRLIHELEAIRAISTGNRASPATPVSPAPSEADVLEIWRQKRASIEQIQAEVQELVAKHQDYARAATLLEAIPPRLRDENLFLSLCQRRDRVAELEREVRLAVDAMALDGLGPKVEELRELKPQRRDLPMLLDMLSRHDEAKRLVEKEQDYGAAVTILEELPEELRDPELYPRLRSIHERILKLESKIQQARQHGNLPELEASVSELSEIVPHRPDLARLQDWITDHRRAVELFNSGRDHQTTLELLERIPPDLRDESLYKEVQRKIRISQLEHEIGQEVAAGRLYRSA